MAVLKYRKPNGEFVEVLVPVNAIENITVKPDEPDTPVVPDIPVEPEEPVVITPVVPIPNMYHTCASDTPTSGMEINVENIDKLTFDYEFKQTTVTANTKSTVSISVYIGARYSRSTSSFSPYGHKEVMSVLKSVKEEVQGTFTVDVTDYKSIIINISSSKTSSGYIGEAGYVVIDNFIPE